jgi:hypothetical protein
MATPQFPLQPNYRQSDIATRFSADSKLYSLASLDEFNSNLS